MRHMVRFVFAATLALHCLCACAQSDTRVTWACWCGGGADIYCLLQSAGPGEEGAVAAAASGGRPLPAIVRAIRHDPASLEDRPIVIPLHTVPYDIDFVRQLAQAVMCGLESACTVAFGRSHAEATGRILASR